MERHEGIGRRELMGALGIAAALAPLGKVARGAGLLGGLGSAGVGSGLTGLLGKASDSALTRLAQPGAFYNDAAVRIALPLLGGLGGGASGLLGQVLGKGGQLGLTDGLVRKLNEAAGLAANAAKPVFRTAISRLSVADVPGIVGKSDGATQYLRTSAGSELTRQVRPLIDDALGKFGAFAMLDHLGKSGQAAQLAGIGHDRLGSSVTEQALNGIYKYMGAEEGKLRANPLGPAGSLLGGLVKPGG